MKFRHKVTLLLVIFFSVPTIFLSIVWGQAFINESNDILKKSVTSAGMLQSNNVNTFFSDRERTLYNLASLVDIKSIILEAKKGTSSSEFKQQSEKMDNTLKIATEEDRYVQELFISLEPENLIISSSNGQYIGEKPIPTLTSKETNSKKAIYSTVYQSDIFLDGETHMYIILPIYDDGVYIGYIASAISIDYFENLAENGKFYETGYLMIMDPTGLFVATGGEKKYESISNISDPNTLSKKWAETDIAYNPSGIIEYKLNSKEKMGYYSKLYPSGWYVMSTVLISELRAPIYRAMMRVGAVIIGLSFLLFFSVRFVTLSFIKPVDGIKKAMAEVAKGNYDNRFLYYEPDEFGEINDLFNEMVNQLLKTQNELRLDQERYEIIFEQAEDIIFEYDIEKDFMKHSGKQGGKFGYLAQGENFKSDNFDTDFVHIEDLAIFEELLSSKMIIGENTAKELRVKNPKGKYVWLKIAYSKICDEEGKVLKVVGKIEDIDRKKKDEHLLKVKAQVDSLTGILNKAALSEIIPYEMELSESNVTSALFVMDIDNFKSINDNFGHLYGDKVLASVSQKIKTLFRKSDIIGRFGGDEFVVFMQGYKDLSYVKTKCNQLNLLIKETYSENEIKCTISASIGVAIFPDTKTEFKELFKKADEMLYESKNRGKNCATIICGEEIFNDFTDLESVTAEGFEGSHSHGSFDEIGFEKELEEIKDIEELSIEALRYEVKVLNERLRIYKNRAAFETNEIVKINDALTKLSHGDLSLNIEKAPFTEETKELFEYFSKIEERLVYSVNTIKSYIEEVDKFVKKISQKDLDIYIYREYVGDFAGFKHSINKISSTLNEMMEEIADQSTSLQVDSSQLMEASLRLAQGSSEQAASIQEVTAGIFDIQNSFERLLLIIKERIEKDKIPVSDSFLNEYQENLEKESILAKAMDQLSMIVQENAALAEETASLGEELSASAEIFKNMVSSYNLKRNKKDQVLKMAVTDYQPFIICHEDGSISGLDIEIVTEAFHRNGIGIEHFVLDWEESIEMLKDGRIDFIPAMSFADDRTDHMEFSFAYRDKQNSIFFTKSSTEISINEYEDLYKYKIGVLREHVYEEKFMNDPVITKDFSAKPADMFKKLLTGKVDAILVNEYIGGYFVREEGLEITLNKEQFTFQDSTDDARIACSKVNRLGKFIKIFDKELLKMGADGTVSRLETKYLIK